MRLIVRLLILSILVLGLNAQSFDKVKMDDYFSKIEKYQKAMGSISIFKDGKEVYQKSLGFLDVSKNLKAGANTRYRIGSISKTFTATIIMQLIEEDKLKLDSKLATFFPGMPNAEKITIEHLMRHRSGLFNFTNDSEYLKWMEKPKTRDELIQLFKKNGKIFEPDEKTSYSNTNYVLLSFILEKIEKKGYAEILKNRITIPLKLKNTYYGGKIKTDKDEAQSYKKTNIWELATETDMSIPMGAGGIVSSPTDLNTFFNNLFSGKLVSAKSLNQMKKIVGNIGMGLFKFPFYNRYAFGHGGGIDGFQSIADYFPEDKVSVAYITNGVVMSMNNILIGALSIYFGREYSIPDFSYKPDIKDLSTYSGIYSSAGFPLKVTISVKGNILMGQATGQPSFSLEGYKTHKFKFDQWGLKLEFIPEENAMILKQGGKEFKLTKEKTQK